MRITNDQTTFGAYFTNNKNFRTILKNSELRPQSIELMQQFRKLPNHEVEIVSLVGQPNQMYSANCEVYNKMTGVLRTFSIRSYEQIESLLIKLLNTPEGRDFFDEKTTLAKVTKGLTTPHSVNEKLEM